MATEDRIKQLKQLRALKRLTEPQTDIRFRFYQYEDSEAATNSTLLGLDDVIIVNNGLFDLDIIFSSIRKNELVAIDFETDGTEAEYSTIWGIGISDGKNNYYVVVKHLNTITNVVDDIYPKEEIRNFLLELNKRYRLVAHNAKFEYKLAYTNYQVKLKFTHDTMGMAYVGLGITGSTLALKKLSQFYLKRYPLSWLELVGDKYKDRVTESGIEQVDLDRLACYCAEDAYETVHLVSYLDEVLRKHNLLEIYKLDLEVTHITADMELIGIEIDRKRMINLKDALTAELEVIQDEITNMLGYFPNVKSSPQMNKLLYVDLQIPTDGIRKTQTGYATDAKTRAELIGFHPVLNLLNDLTLGRDLISKFLEPIPSKLDWDNTLRCQFNVYATLTGRLSSSDPNVQQVPNPAKYAMLGNAFMAKVGKEVRQCFKAREGYTLVKVDYAAIELRILAYFSNDPTLVDCFNSGLDMHSIVCCMLFNLPEVDRSNPQHESMRTLTKTLNFGLCYGMTEFRLYGECKIRGLNYTLDECREIIKEYWRKLPKVKEFFDRVKMGAIVNGYTETIMGRKRFFTFDHPYLKALKGTNTELTSYNMRVLEAKKVITPSDAGKLREAQNAPIQGSNADITKTAMSLCTKYVCNENECRLLLTIHDELVFEVLDSELHYYTPLIKRYMEDAIVLNVPVIAEPKISLTWG